MFQKSTPQDDSYVAAVVEYQVQMGLNNNIENFNRLIKEAAEQVIVLTSAMLAFFQCKINCGGRLLPRT